MEKLQFRVLYREFLFRLVDRELLSASAQGDASKLMGRLAAILVLLSVAFSLPVVGVGNSRLSHTAVLTAAWGAEHALIATTMLIVGLFTVLSWESAYPDRRDVFVLGPLPVWPRTIFAAKISALAAGLSLAVILFNAGPGLLFPLALAPRTASILDLLVSLEFYRLVAAYWITMFAAGAFILCGVLAVQGIAAQLPRRLFLRVSAFLQLAVFCVFLAGYFLSPSLTSPQMLTAAQNQHLLGWLPSYWFLGLFQQLNGSLDGPAGSVLVALATRAWLGVGLGIGAAGAAFLSSYFRILRKIAEQPDIVPAEHKLRWLPGFGNSLATAVTQFSIRSLFRSRHHRVLLAFYAGIGFAIVILFVKSPVARQLLGSISDPWHQASVPLLASSFVMMCAWILGIRIAFAMPLDLRANWIFRITQIRQAPQYLAASRRAAYALALMPVWAASAVLFVSIWPWHQAMEHLIVLVLTGIIMAELWLRSFHKIPFTCSYLPGRSNLHITFVLCLLLGLNAVYWSAAFERRALSDMTRYLSIIFVLLSGAFAARHWALRTNAGCEKVQFEEEMPPIITSLGLQRDGIALIEM